MIITLPQLNGRMRFESVSFQYSANGPRVLNGVDFVVEPGTSVGIVGRSGSGKSTLAKLLQRLYLPTEWAIYVDDIDVRHMNPYWMRFNIGVVLQENYLFSGTIRENISLPRPDAPMELILEVAKMAGPTSLSPSFRKATTPRSANGEVRCPADTGSASPLPGP